MCFCSNACNHINTFAVEKTENQIEFFENGIASTYIYIYTKKLTYDLYKWNCSYNKQFLKFLLPAIGIQLMSKHHPRLHFGQLYH